MGFFRKLFRRGSSDEVAPAAPADQHATAVAEAVEPPPNAADVPTEPLDTLPEIEPSPERSAGTAVFGGTNLLGTKQLATAPLVAGIQSARGLAAWSARDLGRVRRSNQDSVFSMVLSLPDGEHDMPVGLFVVADGMGGHEGGEIASRRAIETVMVTVLEQLALPAMADEDPGNALPVLMVSAVQEANARIWKEAQERGTDMGTTCTAVLMVGDGLYIAHVGDSRAYLSTAAGLRPITTDHSTVGRLIEMGQITLADSRTHPQRNQLYRTVGQHPDVQVESLYHPIEGVSHLLICSDGLWGMVDDD
ncbi:MAG TPA: protein phosphatase 2C domain-containing protein, partial [Herpetosiphonaceae bacterium]|nr:protein phosphatase 2C domain-containing protein [Herpetosiphonaceae bacterium]